MKRKQPRLIRSSGAYAQKHGHDYIVTNDTHGVYGVFDGTGNNIASRLASEITAQNLRTESPYRTESRPAFIMRLIQESLIKKTHCGIIYACTTGTITQVRPSKNGDYTLDYASAGDSPLLVSPSSDKPLRHITIDENLDNYYLHNNFLGSPNHRLHQIGSVALSGSDWRAVIVSDGVTNTELGGLDSSQINDIVRSSEPEFAAAHIIRAVNIYDDASAIVIGSAS